MRAQLKDEVMVDAFLQGSGWQGRLNERTAAGRVVQSGRADQRAPGINDNAHVWQIECAAAARDNREFLVVQHDKSAGRINAYDTHQSLPDIALWAGPAVKDALGRLSSTASFA